jgi:hypothetical protein
MSQITDDEVGAQSVTAMIDIGKKYASDHLERGTIPCPRCKGTLDYSCTKGRRTRVVMRGKCRTPACLEFLT